MDECRRFDEIPASFGLVVLFAVSKCVIRTNISVFVSVKLR